MRAIRLERYGGPEVLQLVEMDSPKPKAGEVLVRNHATGINFLETRQRRGDYPLPIPGGIGGEGAGVVAALGEGVMSLKLGDRVGYISTTQGAHAEEFIVPETFAVKLPEAVSFERAAATMMKGLTARMLLKGAYKVQPGDSILVWAAAGGMGQHVVQWGARLGAKVIAVVGSAEKAAIPRDLGAAHVLISSEDDIAARVRDLTGGEGVAAVYDAIGKDSARASLDSLAPLGTFVNYGSASGHPDPLVVTDLSDKGSLFYTRAVLYTYIRTPALYRELADDVMDALARGILNLPAPKIYPLAEIGAAHRDIASRATTGSLVLKP
ncbi:MAG: quinone oxidoreductase [Hyphomonadaceae bacterium]